MICLCIPYCGVIRERIAVFADAERLLDIIVLLTGISQISQRRRYPLAVYVHRKRAVHFVSDILLYCRFRLLLRHAAQLYRLYKYSVTYNIIGRFYCLICNIYIAANNK